MLEFHKIETLAANQLIKIRWSALVLSSIFIIFAATGLQHFKMNADPRAYFAKDDIHLLRFKASEQKYGRVDGVTFALEVKEGSLYTKENLTLLKQLTDDAWNIPYAQRVDSLANYTYSWSVEDDLYVEELIEDASLLDDEKVKRIKRIAYSDRDIVDRLASTRGEIAIVNVIVNLPYIDRVTEEASIDEAAKIIARRYETENPNIDIALTGSAVSNTATISKGMSDSAKLIPIMYLIIFGLLFIFLRSIAAVFIIFVITASSTTAALGMAFHLGIELNMLSIASTNIVITVSIAHCVHLLNGFIESYQSGLDKSKTGKQKALLESLRINLQPIFLTSFTTGLGFLSMNFSKMPPAHDLGNISAIGVGIAFALSLTVLPALALSLPIRKNSRGDGSVLQKRMSQLADFVIGNRHALLVISFAFSFGMLALVPQNEINDVFTENIKKPSQFREDNEKIDYYFGGLYTIEFDFHAPPNSSISDPEYLNAIDKFVSYLNTQEHVKNVRSYSNIIKRLNMNMHGDDPTYYAIPNNKEEAAQYLLLFELSQPIGADMTHYIQADKSATKMTIAIEQMDSLRMKNIGIEYYQWVKENLPSYMHKEPTSLIYMWSHLSGSSSTSAILGALFALLIISIILTLVFKSIRYGIISLIPNLLPAGIGYGVWALHSGMLQMSQMMVLSITIGIVVDDTVHFLSKYLRARRENNASSQDAVRYAFQHVGAPLWITTAVLVCGFGLLITSSFVPNSDLGSLTAIILIAALALDFFMLPPLLMLIDKDPVSNKSEIQ
jgi:predicted RND superfamily exporter protein